MIFMNCGHGIDTWAFGMWLSSYECSLLPYWEDRQKVCSEEAQPHHTLNPLVSFFAELFSFFIIEMIRIMYLDTDPLLDICLPILSVLPLWALSLYYLLMSSFKMVVFNADELQFIFFLLLIFIVLLVLSRNHVPNPTSYRWVLCSLLRMVIPFAIYS